MLAEARSCVAAERAEGARATQEALATVASMLERTKEMALSLTFTKKNFKLYSQIVSKPQKSPKKNEETPFRLSLTPFPKDNSLLISVKRNL